MNPQRVTMIKKLGVENWPWPRENLFPVRKFRIGNVVLVAPGHTKRTRVPSRNRAKANAPINTASTRANNRSIPSRAASPALPGLRGTAFARPAAAVSRIEDERAVSQFETVCVDAIPNEPPAKPTRKSRYSHVSATTCAHSRVEAQP